MPRKGSRSLKKRSLKRRSHRKTLKGGYYGASGAIAPGAMEWSRGSEMGDWAISSRGNNAIYGSGRKRKSGKGADQIETGPAFEDSTNDNTPLQATAGRRRRRSGKKITRRRKIRGGASFGAVAASYQGTGSRGIADYAQTNTKYPPFGGAQYGAFNNAGAQPGSGFGSFIRAN